MTKELKDLLHESRLDLELLQDSLYAYSKLARLQDEVKDFIFISRAELIKQDFNDLQNRNSLRTLLVATERLMLRREYAILWKVVEKNNIPLGALHHLPSMYFFLKEVDVFLSGADSVFKVLKDACFLEEESVENIIHSLTNYYLFAVLNLGRMNLEAVKRLRSKIIDTIHDERNLFFLQKNTLLDFLNTNIDNPIESYNALRLRQDLICFGHENGECRSAFEIECETEYCHRLQSMGGVSIQNLLTLRSRYLPDESLGKSLDRGKTIIRHDEQLSEYFFRYGKMHIAKLESVMEILEKSCDFSNRLIDVMDWGCGLGLASLVFMEHNHKKKKNLRLEKVTLIEPSNLALKRAAYHCKMLCPSVAVNTLNHDFDSIRSECLPVFDSSTVHLHFFSNVLDIETFSLEHLAHLVENNFPGTNVVVCVSPYINEWRNARIIAFVDRFKHCKGYQLIKKIENPKGEWQNNWSRFIVVFKFEKS